MAYNFIESASKTPFSPGVRRVWYVGAALLAVVLAFAAVLHVNSAEQRKLVAQEHAAQETLKVQVEQLVQQQSQFESSRSLRQQNDTANQLLTDQLSDLLDLVPDDATLERFEMNATALLYEGECLRFEKLQTDLGRALSGQFRLAESLHSPSNGQTHFILRFTAERETR